MSIPTPYQGNEPYIFVSYPHKDSDVVLPIISTLQEQGFRVWFDAGIEFGMPWDNDIAGHVRKCDVFIAMMSPNYLNSDNCCDELHFARECKKPSLLIYTQAVTLPDHIAMRYGRLQALHHYELNADDFLHRIHSSKILNAVKAPLCTSSRDHSFSADSLLARQHQLVSPASSAALPLDRILSHRYLIGSHLGHGLLGNIYAAEDIQTKREVLLHIFTPSSLPKIPMLHPGLSARLMENPHSNLPLLYGTEFLPDGSVMVITERIHGTPLLHLAAEGQLTFLEKAHYLLQMCGALSFLHQLGCVHCDLSMSSFMADGIQLYLTDIYSLRPYEKYQSSECAYSPAADVYAMGVMIKKLLIENKLPLSDLSITYYRDLLELVDLATNQDASKRPSMKQLENDLAEILRHNLHHETIRTDLSHRR